MGLLWMPMDSYGFLWIPWRDLLNYTLAWLGGERSGQGRGEREERERGKNTKVSFFILKLAYKEPRGSEAKQKQGRRTDIPGPRLAARPEINVGARD